MHEDWRQLSNTHIKDVVHIRNPSMAESGERQLEAHGLMASLSNQLVSSGLSERHCLKNKVEETLILGPLQARAHTHIHVCTYTQ